MDEKEITQLLDLFDERQAKKAEADAAEKTLKEAFFEEGKKAGKAEAEKELSMYKENKAPLHMKTAKTGSGGEHGDVSTFFHYVRTGDVVAARKSLEEVTSDEDRIQANENNDPETRKALSQLTGAAGQFLVPEDVVQPDRQADLRAFLCSPDGRADLQHVPPRGRSAGREYRGCRVHPDGRAVSFHQ